MLCRILGTFSFNAHCDGTGLLFDFDFAARYAVAQLLLSKKAKAINKIIISTFCGQLPARNKKIIIIVRKKKKKRENSTRCFLFNVLAAEKNDKKARMIGAFHLHMVKTFVG